MTSARPITRTRSRANSATLSLRFGPESISKYARAFSKSVFHCEIASSLSSKESIIALTDDETDVQRILHTAEALFPQTYFVTASRCRARLLSKWCSRVLAAQDFWSAAVPDGACVIVEDLWLISNPSFGCYLEHILLVLGSQSIVILISKPFSNISVFYHWFSGVRSSQPRVIEAPFERCPSSYFVLSEKDSELTLVRNSALPLDSLALTDSLARASTGFPSKDAVSGAIRLLLNADFGPVLVVVPSCGYFDRRYPCLSTLSDGWDHQIRIFQADERAVLYVTTKVAENLFIPTHSIIVTSLLKYDGRVCRELQPSEFYHLTRSTGRSGIDTQGIVVTSLLPGMSISFLTNTFLADIPWLTPHFSLNFCTALACRVTRIDDLDEFTTRTCSGFCQTQVLPILRDQLAAVAQNLPPREISDRCVRMAALETSISTLCTHPWNVRRLLTHGRVVRVRPPIAERPWGICFGTASCGTVTLAMKGIPNRLVTVPVSEVLAVSSVIAPIPRGLVKDIEPDYPLYDGDELAFGRERLHALHREWRALELAISERWREVADLPLKQAYLQVRVEAMSKAAKRIRWDSSQIAGFDRELIEVVLRLGIADGIALRAILASGVLEQLSDIGVACAVLVFLDRIGPEGGLGDGEVTEVWGHLARIGQFDPAWRKAIASLAAWISSTEPSPAVEYWEGACRAKRVAGVLAGLEKFAREAGKKGVAERCAAGRAAILRAPGFAFFFQ
jgi:hypothetical protein